jgi:dTDP-4-amino-4,6-dideoxygalactose transaminase
MINVTETYLPPREEYLRFLDRAWDKKWITNHGELVQELEAKLTEFNGVDHLLYCANGTVAIQIALRALNITREVITTPFSYVATVNSILWEGCAPIFADIDPRTFCIDPASVERQITTNTEAILATHVYGIPCDVERIEQIARKHNLKVIYDGAHAFGCRYLGQSLLSYGDLSTCSFHATKLFHTVEGGCVISRSDDVWTKLKLYRSFGHIGDDYHSIGINAKNSEFHAAMGLAMLPHLTSIIHGRKKVSQLYDQLLGDKIGRPVLPGGDFQYNYAYYPVIFANEKVMLKTREELLKNEISTRRYFYPSLNNVPQVKSVPCPVSDDISARVLCLPLYPSLPESDVHRISSIILRSIQ